ncbi:unnamed protein product [Trichogramma brassicae]|uniref:CCHC-type domain-containing protein n=1 Tax=Trichogramma brassicae TaxID=86971 RepID=A0A6H5J6A4_9HYME|nr:unnamed protein product [Trichogramma brassicae]
MAETNIADWVAFCNDLPKNFQRVRAINPSSQTSRLCYNCYEEGHLKRDCKVSRPGIICRRCGKEGHIARYYQEPLNENATAARPSQSAFKTKSSGPSYYTNSYTTRRSSRNQRQAAWKGIVTRPCYRTTERDPCNPPIPFHLHRSVKIHLGPPVASGPRSQVRTPPRSPNIPAKLHFGLTFLPSLEKPPIPPPLRESVTLRLGPPVAPRHPPKVLTPPTSPNIPAKRPCGLACLAPTEDPPIFNTRREKEHNTTNWDASPPRLDDRWQEPAAQYTNYNKHRSPARPSGWPHKNESVLMFFGEFLRYSTRTCSRAVGVGAARRRGSQQHCYSAHFPSGAWYPYSDRPTA